MRRHARVAGRVNGVVGIAAGVMAAALCNSANAADVRLVRMVDPEDMITIKAADGWMVIEGSGRLVFPPDAQSLLLFDDPDDPTESLALIDPSKQQSGYVAEEIPIGDAINVTLLADGPGGERLFAFDSTTDEIVSIARAGKFWSKITSIERHDAAALVVSAPAGMTADRVTGEVFILDAGANSIIVLKPAPGKRYGPAIAGDPRYVSRVSLPPGIGAVRGLAHDPGSGELLTLITGTQSLLRLSADGELNGVFELPGVDTSGVRGLAVAPSLDRTDDPSVMHLFIAAAGGIVELSVTGEH